MWVEILLSWSIWKIIIKLSGMQCEWMDNLMERITRKDSLLSFRLQEVIPQRIYMWVDGKFFFPLKKKKYSIHKLKVDDLSINNNFGIMKPWRPLPSSWKSSMKNNNNRTKKKKEKSHNFSKSQMQFASNWWYFHALLPKSNTFFEYFQISSKRSKKKKKKRKLI